jgi:predicted Na+-dependent transporter
VNSFLTPILLGLLLVALIIPVVITIRIEQRWLLTPFIVALLFVSQFPRVTDHFRATTKVVTNAAVVLFVGTGLIANATYFREMEPLFFIGHQSLATVNTMVANSAVENNTISVSEDCATPIATQYLDHLLFANNDGKRVTVTCVGLTPPPGTTFVRLADDGFIELSQ